MNRIRLIVSAAICLLVAAAPAWSQLSDYTVKKNFEAQYKNIENRIDSSKTTAELDTIKVLIDSLDRQYVLRTAFLDRALYPDSFEGRMSELRGRHVLTYDRVYLIQTKGFRIAELEERIAFLTGRIDTLTAERNKLFVEVQENRKNVQNLRESVRRLTANLALKDKLLFALVDSLFLPYDKNLSQVSEMQKEAISRKLEKANVVSRVYEFASDNLKFLEVTQLQAKDFANLIDQYQQFKSKWDGLSDKMNAVVVSSEQLQPTSAAAADAAARARYIQRSAKLPPPRAAVDSVLAEWNKRMQAAFWGRLLKEFTDKQLTVLPFTDGQSFSSSIRAYVEAVKQSGQDASVFADEVWRDRVDKEWRDALTKENMLGKNEYAALDKLVSELSKEKVDLRFVLYIAAIIILAVAVWWIFFRKRKPKAPPAPATR